MDADLFTSIQDGRSSAFHAATCSALPRSTFGEQAIYTPDPLAAAIVSHFKPSGRICEPCKGGGAFVRAMPGCEWFEIEEGRDFLQADGQWDWIVTNPPWKDTGAFLQKSMKHADNIVFLCWLTAMLTKARNRMVQEAGFGVVEMLLVPTPPPPWPQSGFQLAATWVRRGWQGSAAFSSLNDQALRSAPTADVERKKDSEL